MSYRIENYDFDEQIKAVARAAEDSGLSGLVMAGQNDEAMQIPAVKEFAEKLKAMSHRADEQRPSQEELELDHLVEIGIPYNSIITLITTLQAEANRAAMAIQKSAQVLQMIGMDDENAPELITLTSATVSYHMQLISLAAQLNTIRLSERPIDLVLSDKDKEDLNKFGELSDDDFFKGLFGSDE